MIDPNDRLDVLVIAPHPDDAELGAAGAILQYKADGYRVGVLDLTSGEPTPFGSPEIRARETAAATAILGLDWRGNLGLPNRQLQATLEARAQLAGVIRQLRPRLLLSPYWVDAHPDHLAAVDLIEAARFWSKLTKTDMPGEPHHPQRILYYNCVHLRLVEKPAIVLDISRHWERKLAAIACYRSQFIEGRPSEPPTFLDKLRDQAAFWGQSIGVAYGEPLSSREPLGASSLRDLV
jgi:bacillithiol biosynthesis deacetylase BshB1